MSDLDLVAFHFDFVASRSVHMLVSVVTAVVCAVIVTWAIIATTPGPRIATVMVTAVIATPGTGIATGTRAAGTTTAMAFSATTAIPTLSVSRRGSDLGRGVQTEMIRRYGQGQRCRGAQCEPDEPA
jgi:hypothetical protein